LSKSRDSYSALLESHQAHQASSPSESNNAATSPKPNQNTSPGALAVEFEKYLCLQCLIRKELFEKITQSLPRSFRKTLTLKWPLVAMDKIPQHLPIAPVMEQEDANLPTSSMSFTGTVSFSLPAMTSPIDLLRSGSPPKSPLLPFSSPLATITSSTSPGDATTVMTLEQLSTYMAPIESTFQSPIASMKLQQLDFMQSLTQQQQQQQAIKSPQKIVFDEDEVSLPSISGLSLTSSQDASSASIPSTVTTVDPFKKPREMTLLPYLIAKGHFEEAERMVRIAIGKQAVDEGEGMYLLLKVLGLQADMYKMMGLWPLAMAIYIDIAELTASLLGLSDNVTFKALTLVSSCFRKMQQPKLAEDYMKHCIEQLGYNLKKSSKDNMIERLQRLNR
jgi:hypothetical protein